MTEEPKAIEIRSAKTLEEVKQLAELHPEYSVTTGYLGSPQYELHQITEGNRELVYATDNGALVGAVQILYKDMNPDDPRLMAGNAAHLQRLRVKEEYRRRGIGRHLCEIVEAMAADQGHPLITLDVESDNEPAIRLYEGLGYEEFVRLKSRYPGNSLVCMRKTLNVPVNNHRL